MFKGGASVFPSGILKPPFLQEHGVRTGLQAPGPPRRPCQDKRRLSAAGLSGGGGQCPVDGPPTPLPPAAAFLGLRLVTPH